MDCLNANQQTQPRFEVELKASMPSLRAHALKLGLSRDQADDLVQDTMLRALRFRASFQPGTYFNAWVHRVLVSIFMTHCRKRRRETRALDSLHRDPNSWQNPTPDAQERFLSPSVKRALGSLPEHYREVVRLVDLSELTYQESAARLGVPVGTVMSRLHRARKQLSLALAGASPTPSASRDPLVCIAADRPPAEAA